MKTVNYPSHVWSILCFNICTKNPTWTAMRHSQMVNVAKHALSSKVFSPVFIQAWKLLPGCFFIFCWVYIYIYWAKVITQLQSSSILTILGWDFIPVRSALEKPSCASFTKDTFKKIFLTRKFCFLSFQSINRHLITYVFLWCYVILASSITPSTETGCGRDVKQNISAKTNNFGTKLFLLF